jgi:hypothetical protein
MPSQGILKPEGILYTARYGRNSFTSLHSRRLHQAAYSVLCLIPDRHLRISRSVMHKSYQKRGRSGPSHESTSAPLAWRDKVPCGQKSCTFYCMCAFNLDAVHM